MLHYNRAIISYLQLPNDYSQRLQSEEWTFGTGEGVKPTLEELETAIKALDFVYLEVHALAVSADFKWDHRIRNLTGADVYEYRLNDVQEIRSLARLLQVRIRFQLRQGDFDGAISSISDEICLAEFVGQGETVVQKLVGIAIQAMMRDRITNAIATPGCPNLYWAIATIPQPLNSMSESVLWELNNVSRVLPVFGRSRNR